MHKQKDIYIYIYKKQQYVIVILNHSFWNTLVLFVSGSPWLYPVCNHSQGWEGQPSNNSRANHCFSKTSTLEWESATWEGYIGHRGEREKLQALHPHAELCTEHGSESLKDGYETRRKQQSKDKQQWNILTRVQWFCPLVSWQTLTAKGTECLSIS